MSIKDNVCLQVKNGSTAIQVAACDFNNDYQKWTFQTYTQEYEDLVKGTSTKYKELMDSLMKYKQYFT